MGHRHQKSTTKLMLQTEPTYLRYINDELLKGKLNAENPAGLPDGFSGIYDEVFTAQMSVKEREKLLQQLAVWALLKKEVSASFVAEILETSEEEVQELVGRFSSWFNSPESGKYQLYHERLKVYLLQKIPKSKSIELQHVLIDKLEHVKAGRYDEFFNYRNEYLIFHLGVTAFYKNTNRDKLLMLLSNDKHFKNITKYRVSRNLVFDGLSSVLLLSMHNEDWLLFKSVVLAAVTYHDKLNNQVILDLEDRNTNWSDLYEHFDSAQDNEERLRFFFLLCLEDRNWQNEWAQSLLNRVRQISEEEYIDLSELAPIWLIKRTRILFNEDEKIKAFFAEVDFDELIELHELNPNFDFMIEEIEDYSQTYLNNFRTSLNVLRNDDLIIDEQFDQIFNAISKSNLISRDEIVTRVTIELLKNDFEKINTINWFFWLLTKSKFEIGEHSWGRENTYELCIQYLMYADEKLILKLSSQLNDIEMDYHIKLKLRNHISELLVIQNALETAKKVLIVFGNQKVGTFNTSAWIRNWILFDLKGRIGAKILLEPYDKLEIDFTFFNKEIVQISDFKKSDLYKSLQELDKVTRAEFLANFAVRIKDDHLSQNMIEDAWSLIYRPEDWAEFFAKISVFTASLQIKPKVWIEKAFRSLKRGFDHFDENYYFHLSETVFKTSAFRFSKSGPYQFLKKNFKKEYKYLIKTYPDLKSKAEEEIAFTYFLKNELNQFESIKEMWKEARHFFRKGGPGEYFISFWDYVPSNTGLFNHFTVEDVRIINVLSGKINVRFPFEKYTELHLKINRYSERFDIPDNWRLGSQEGLPSIAKFSDYLNFDQGYRTVFSAAMDKPLNNSKESDWTRDSIVPLAFATKKVIAFPDDVRKIIDFLELRERLLVDDLNKSSY